VNVMRDPAHENLSELLRQFMDESTARATQEDLKAVERMMAGCPAPTPSRGILSAIKTQMIVSALHRRRRIRIFRRAMAAAAALVMTILIAQHGRNPAGSSSTTFASILPAAVWESNNLAADDPDLVYFTSEIRQIEAQMRDLEAGDTDIRGRKTLDELELELLAMETEFWKG